MSSNLGHSRILAIALSLVCACLAHGEEQPAPAGDVEVSYYRQIRPIFQAHCQGCHQPAKPLGRYVMTGFDALLAGGETGDPAIVPGKPDESYLIDQIVTTDGSAEMPKNADPLDAQEVALIRQWIEQGAKNDTPASAKRTFDAEHPPTYVRPPVVNSLDYSPDGKLLAIAGFNEVLLHRTDTAEGENSLVARLIGMSEKIQSVSFSPDGTRLAVSGGSPALAGEIQVWDVAKQELKLSLPITHDTVYGISWSPDGKMLAFGCADSTVRGIDAATGEQLLYQGSHNGWVFDTVFGVDGRHVVSVSRDMTAKLIEVPTQRFVDNITSITPKALKGGINSVARHPSRDQILIGGADGIPKIYGMHRKTERRIGDDANQLWELPSLPGRIFSVDYSRDGSRIAAGSSLDGKGAVHIYGIDPQFKVPKEINTILVKPTHTRSQEELDKLAKYFAEGIQVLATIDVEAAVYAVSISPDGQHVSAAGTDGTIRIYSASNGQLHRAFAPVEVSPEAMRQSKDQQFAQQWKPTIDAQSLPEGARVVALNCEPEVISLSDPTQYVQLIVTAELDSGDLVDVTRSCNFNIDAPRAAVGGTGVVTPTADGRANLVAELNGQVAVSLIEVFGLNDPQEVDYVRDVMPAISRMGCNAGTCHGSKDGKNGFKLSLRGYDPIYDVRAFTDDVGSRRVNLASPADSLMLLKATAAVPHEGGQLTHPGSKYYRLVHDWIAGGAKLDLNSSRVSGITVHPVNPVVQQVGARQQMRVVATYEDGSQKDVTQEAFIESGNTDIVESVQDYPGLIKVLRRGEAPILVRFEGNYAATTVTVMGDRTGFVWQQPPQNNAIDGFVAEKLKRTKTAASPICTDYEFIRRIHLDLTGLPPTAEEIRNFVNDPRDSRWKRDELIDQLVGSPAYVDHWSNKWADLLQVNSKFLGAEGASAFRKWIHDRVEENMPYDQMVRQILTSTGSNLDNPAASYFKILRTPQDAMENTTHLFLATRFNCNKCHDHPFERWTQDQYYEMAAFFAQVGLKKDDRSKDKQIGRTAVESGKPLFEIVFDKEEGEIKHDRTGAVTAPQVPYEASAEWKDSQSRREQLAAWITSPDNQYFAKSYVNRLWGYLTGTGIIEPIDDIRAGNPPTNPELLAWLTEQFLSSNFDSQHVVREICKSRTYQLSIKTNQWNEDDDINYSHAKARRLPAEVLYDTIHVVTGAKSKFPGVPVGTRAAALPDVGIKLPDGFLGNLGRPARESACECERSNDLQLGPVMALVSGPTVGEALAGGENALSTLVASIEDDHELFNELFLRILNRPADDEEVAAAIDTMRIMQEEHDEMSARLVRAERAWKPKEAELESQRWARVAEAEKTLNAHIDKTAEAVAKAKKDREDRIANAEAALAKYESELPTHLSAWERSDELATDWKTVDFDSMSATHKAKLVKLDDGSILASGKEGRGNYDLAGDFYAKKITGIRIEALTDESLPNRGPGRAEDGNFVLTDFRLQWADPTKNKETEAEKWTFEEGTADWQPNEQAKLESQEGVLNLTSTGNDPSISRQVTVAGRLFLLEFQAKLTSSAESQLFWSTSEANEFAEDRSIKLTLAGQGQWLPYRYYFRSDADLTGLRFDPDAKPGSILIREIKLTRIEEPEFKAAVLVDPQADFSQDKFDVSKAIDGKNPTNEGWAIAPEMGKNHAAVFALKEPIETQLGAKLKVTLMQNFQGDKHSLGRFRISVTTSPQPLDFGLPEDVDGILKVAADQRNEEQKDRLLEYFGKFSRQKRKLGDQLEEAQKPLPVDPELTRLQESVAEAKQPIRIDPALVRLRQHVEASTGQLTNKRLTAAQDVAWALINNPAFLFNH